MIIFSRFKIISVNFYNMLPIQIITALSRIQSYLYPILLVYNPTCIQSYLYTILLVSNPSCTVTAPGLIIHCDLKVANSQGKIYENFANNFLTTTVINKSGIVLKCACLGLQENIWVRVVKSKPKALWHFKVDSVLKIDAKFL